MMDCIRNDPSMIIIVSVKCACMSYLPLHLSVFVALWWLIVMTCLKTFRYLLLNRGATASLPPWLPPPFNCSVYKDLEKHCQTYCSPCLPSCAPCSRLWAGARLLWDLEHDKIVAGLRGDGGTVCAREGGGGGGMCGKPRKIFYKMGSSGQKCSTLVLWLLKISGLSHPLLELNMWVWRYKQLLSDGNVLSFQFVCVIAKAPRSIYRQGIITSLQ